MVLAGLTSDATLLEVGLETIGRKEVVKVEKVVVAVVVVVLVVDANELDEESCIVETAAETELKEERVGPAKPEEVD